MIKVNEKYGKRPGDYLVAEIARRTAAYSAENPDKTLIKLGIGDVTLPLPAAVVAAMKRASDDMLNAGTFYGYGPYEGYEFLRGAIVENEYAPFGAPVGADEIFVSDGAKSDCGNIGDIFSADNVVAVCDPVYPVYVDVNAMAGRAGEWDGKKWTKIVYMPCTAENGFIPALPETVPDIIYLCFPNNPTGATATKDQLRAWVDYANAHGSVILFDAAYRAYISDPALPRSIYEIDGARDCAIEFCSYSKTAGFTGTRCGWTVVPKSLRRGGESLHAMWFRRQSTKYNGTSYIIQRGAEAVYSPEGKKQVAAIIDYYMSNARFIRSELEAAGLTVSGGVNSPYIWFKTPSAGSWEFFDRLLREANVVTTPGAGFGPAGEGYIRLTAFGNAERTKEAVRRVKAIL
jgi:LL-diaminopimelate aminotransferase